MSNTTMSPAIVGEPEVVEDRSLVESAAWSNIKTAASGLQALQIQDGSVAEAADLPAARGFAETIAREVLSLQRDRKSVV